MSGQYKALSLLVLVCILWASALPVVAAPAIQGKTTISPDSIELTLPPGEGFSQMLTVTTAETPVPKLDVLFLFDVTSSMDGVINAAKASGIEIMQAVREKVPDSAFGVASFGDYPSVGDYGSPGDYPWRLDQPLTEGVSTVQAAINDLSAHGGGDGPESYSRALFESLLLEWRLGAKRVIVLFGDAPAHDPDFYGRDFGIDPGPDEELHTSDDLGFTKVVDALAEGPIVIIPINSGADGYALEGFEYMAAQTGGRVFSIESSSQVADAVTQGLEESVTNIRSVTASLSKNAPHWAHLMEHEYTDVGGSESLVFGIDFSVPLDAEPGEHNFSITISGDGAILGTIPAVIAVSSDPDLDSDDAWDEESFALVLDQKSSLIDEMSQTELKWLGLDVPAFDDSMEENLYGDGRTVLGFDEEASADLVSAYRRSGLPDAEMASRFDRLVLSEGAVYDLYKQSVSVGDRAGEAISKIVWLNLSFVYQLNALDKVLPEKVFSELLSRFSNAASKFINYMISGLGLPEDAEATARGLVDVAFQFLGGENLFREAIELIVRYVAAKKVAFDFVDRTQPAIDDAVAKAKSTTAVMNGTHDKAVERLNKEIERNQRQGETVKKEAETKIRAAELAHIISDVVEIAEKLASVSPWKVVATGTKIILRVFSNIALLSASSQSLGFVSNTADLTLQVDDIAYDTTLPVSMDFLPPSVAPIDQVASLGTNAHPARNVNTVAYYTTIRTQLAMDKESFGDELYRAVALAQAADRDGVYEQLDPLAETSMQLLSTFEAGAGPIMAVARDAVSKVTGFDRAYEELFVNAQTYDGEMFQLYADLLQFVETPEDKDIRNKISDQADAVMIRVEDYEDSLEKASALIEVLPMPASVSISDHTISDQVADGERVGITFYLRNASLTPASEVHLNLLPVGGLELLSADSQDLGGFGAREKKELTIAAQVASTESPPILIARVDTDGYQAPMHMVVLPVNANSVPPPLSGGSSGGLGIGFVILAVAVGGVFVYVMRQRRKPLTTEVPPQMSLLITSGQGVGQHVSISQANFLIGRGSTCDFRISDRAVSRQHARLRYAQGAWFIQDQESAIGTYVNGLRVQAIRLNHGDRITIGSTEFEFRIS